MAKNHSLVLNYHFSFERTAKNHSLALYHHLLRPPPPLKYFLSDKFDVAY